MIIDFRNTERKKDDLLGKSSQFMKENLKTFNSQPHIVSYLEDHDAPLLIHHQIYESIIMISPHLKSNKILFQVFSDKKPYDKKQEFFIESPAKATYSIVSIDRRSIEEQENDKFLIFALV